MTFNVQAVLMKLFDLGQVSGLEDVTKYKNGICETIKTIIGILVSYWSIELVLLVF
ncbi:hypothetical protein [Vibrio sp. SCSIO 43136]|uniref:hypothetical protein n=1 Tax=Vibrio sp. SCSIO 43136 TaxID=2819101 RepID=UPI002074C35A|nr:hypothetical protein [Vibrio sp. SCSIO 43136]USD67740.1 hypothetical protein J4N39_16260 [Vibrio sp. SCSIO 43136]